VTAWAREATPEALFGLFRDWQGTQTQSSVRTLSSLRPQMDVRFCLSAGTISREAKCADSDPDQINVALSRARKGKTRAFLLTKTYMEGGHSLYGAHYRRKFHSG